MEPRGQVAGTVTSRSTGAPISGATVFVVDRPETEARTDRDGRYRLELPSAGVEVRLDARAPGFRSVTGAGNELGDDGRVTPAPDRTVNQDVSLPDALYVAGVAMDPDGVPLPEVELWATMEHADGGYGILAQFRLGADGRFALYDFPLEPPEGDQGRLRLLHPDHPRLLVADLYELPPGELARLRLSFARGLRLTGRVVSAAAEPRAGVMVEALFDDDDQRKATLTDGDGRFDLRGLPAARCRLRAHDLPHREKVVRELLLDRDQEDLELPTEPLPPAEHPHRAMVLGMMVCDLTPALRDEYDLDSDHGVLILDPGDEPETLGLGDLREGDCLLNVNGCRIRNVLELVAALRDGRAGCQVLFESRRLRWLGTQTQCLQRPAGEVGS